jgi:hypothetical protein
MVAKASERLSGEREEQSECKSKPHHTHTHRRGRVGRESVCTVGCRAQQAAEA